MRAAALLVILSSSALAGDFVQMTPIGADCLPVTLEVRGDREYARPAGEQLREDIDFSGLLMVTDGGAADISVAIETLSGGRLRMTAEVEAEGEVLLSREYASDASDLYTSVHRIADDAVYALTGEQGIASTRLCFIQRSGSYYALAVKGFDPRGSSTLLRDTCVITTPSWSPDGSEIAFTAFRGDNGDLYFFDTGSSRAGRVLSRQGLNTTPAWTPDGSAVLVMLTLEGNADIYSFAPGSEGLTRLTARSSIETSPSVSPTGQQVVFTSDRTGTPQIYVMDIAGAGAERLSYAHPYCDSPAWSPRGDLIAYAARTPGQGIQIFVMNSDGTGVRQVTSEGTLNEDPAWGPTGRHLAFSSDRSGERSIYVLELNSLTVKRLTTAGECYCPTWSPLPAGTDQ